MLNARYSVGKLSDEFGTTVVRYREGIPREVQIEFPNQFVVEWEFQQAPSHGLPSQEQMEEAEEFGRHLAEVLENGGSSILALVCTGNGFREWYFYCKDVTLMQNLFNAHLQGRALPIKLNAGTDTDWGVYWQFVEPLIRQMAN